MNMIRNVVFFTTFLVHPFIYLARSSICTCLGVELINIEEILKREQTVDYAYRLIGIGHPVIGF